MYEIRRLTPHNILTIRRYIPNVTPPHILIIAATSSERHVSQLRTFFSRYVSFETHFIVSLVSWTTTI